MQKSFITILTFGTCFLTCSSYTVSSQTPVSGENSLNGLYDIWYKNEDVLEEKLIKGGQIMLQWADVENQEGQYDFSVIEQQLAHFASIGKSTTIQINGNKKPQWLYKKVPYFPKPLSGQIRDEQGTLMYWHPVHLGAYKKMIAAYADFIKKSKYKSCLAGIRLNFNALGTEHTNVPENARDLKLWIVPPGARQGSGFKNSTASKYTSEIIDAFVDSFKDVNLMIRNNIDDEIIEKYKSEFENGRLFLFHTSSEIEPRRERQYSLFRRFAATGKTRAYAEPWADAWGKHGKENDARWVSPPQWNYWRLLLDLHCGVSMVALYDDDAKVGFKGVYPVTGEAVPFQNEFLKAFRFASFYAGYHADPLKSPGAWIAFRYSPENILYKTKLDEFSGDYSFLMKAAYSKPNDNSNRNIGPAIQPFGAWARALQKSENICVSIDPVFIKNLQNKLATLRIVYLDSGTASAKFVFNKKESVIQLKNSGKWKTAEFTSEINSNCVPEIKVSSDGLVMLHMINLVRDNGLPDEVSKLKTTKSGSVYKLQWQNPSTPDLDSIRVFQNNKLLLTVAGFTTQAIISATTPGKIKIVTVDESGRTSAGKEINF